MYLNIFIQYFKAIALYGAVAIIIMVTLQHCLLTIVVLFYSMLLHIKLCRTQIVNIVIISNIVIFQVTIYRV